LRNALQLGLGSKLGPGLETPGVRGATTADKLRGPRFRSQLWGALVREGVAPSRCEGPEYHPRKICENSDAKSWGTTCCEISCFFKNTSKKLGDQYIVGAVSPGLYGCCAYAWGTKRLGMKNEMSVQFFGFVYVHDDKCT